MARRGNPYGNAVGESFLRILKTEEVYLYKYETLAEVEKRVSYFIEEVFNRKRLHSFLSYGLRKILKGYFLLTTNLIPVCLYLNLSKHRGSFHFNIL
jgi:transposase InsO family protein